MRGLNQMFVWAAIVTSFAGIQGCESMEESTLPKPVVATPLELDPTEKYELAPWWSNGKQLLRLEDNAAYALYGVQNRYTKPIERGRWSHQSYAVLWLEPYEDRGPRPQRVQITKQDGKLALLLGKYKPLLALDGPPPAAEDKLIGQWLGEMGSLKLDGGMRYTLHPVSGSAENTQPLVVGHGGRWSVANGAVVLQPDTPAVGPIRLQIRQQNNQTTLAGPSGEFSPAKS